MTQKQKQKTTPPTTVTIEAKSVTHEKNLYKIDAQNLHYRELNAILRQLDAEGAKNVEISNVYGQRYIGTNLKSPMKIDIYGTPGNDLSAFMGGQTLEVHGNAQDCICNTMNDGKVIIHGRVGDITGYGMRGGKLFIRDDAGYRVGIHMKEYLGIKPIMVVGGTAQDFLGEYMAGGILLVLGLNLKEGEKHKSRFVGTGMHSGIMYIHGDVASVGKEVKVMDVDEADKKVISELVHEYCIYFNADADKILQGKFQKLVPFSHRPYGRIYAY